MIHELIQTLTPQEKDTLRQRVNRSESSLYKLIEAVLDEPDISKEALLKRFRINENTYFKNISLAKDEIYEVIKMHLRNSYDDLILSNALYRRGLDVQANKLRLKLEAEYDRQGWWSVLHELYSMDMLVAYTKCDIPRMEKIRDKTLRNAERLHEFIHIDREVILQMAIIEKGDLKESAFDAYAIRMNALLKKAKAIDHHIPIFNALHSLYVLYTKYKIDIKKSKEIIHEIQLFLKKYKGRMIAYTVNVAWLNTMGFHVEFATGDKPLAYFKKVEEAIGMHGLLYDAQALLNFCAYYFLAGDKVNFNKRLDQFQDKPTDKSFKYKLGYMHCLRAYMNGDAKNFNQCLNEFYGDDASREYTDHDLTLRYLDILMLIRDHNYSLASDKLDAAIKFVRRNFTSYRITIEKQHWDMLRAALQGKTVKYPPHTVYRLTEFIYKEIA
jgi:hypothetical protein